MRRGRPSTASSSINPHHLRAKRLGAWVSNRAGIFARTASLQRHARNLCIGGLHHFPSSHFSKQSALRGLRQGTAARILPMEEPRAADAKILRPLVFFLLFFFLFCGSISLFFQGFKKCALHPRGLLGRVRGLVCAMALARKLLGVFRRFFISSLGGASGRRTGVARPDE